jgi:transposase
VAHPRRRATHRRPTPRVVECKPHDRRVGHTIAWIAFKATPEQLRDAFGASTDLHPLYRRLLTLTLTELELIDTHLRQLDEELAALLRVHQDAVQRLAAVPGLGVDSAQQIIAEVGPTARTVPTAKHLASWVGACPGHDENAGINHSRPDARPAPPCAGHRSVG